MTAIDNERQRISTSDNECQQVTTNETTSDKTNEIEWQPVIQLAIANENGCRVMQQMKKNESE